MSDKIELNRRRVLGGLVTIGAAGAAAGAGTFAYFSDSEQSTGNTIEAASLDLDIADGDTATTTVNTANGYANGIVPGNSDSGSSSITNTGDITGYVDVSVSENSNGSLSGDLAGELQVTITLSEDDDVGTTTNQTQVYTGSADGLSGLDDETNFELTSNKTGYLIIEWSLPNDGDETAGQGETVAFDVTVELNQVENE